MATHFTEEQLRELETLFNLKRTTESVAAVRDGTVTLSSVVWWRSEEGPQEVSAWDHWRNIKEYPQAYQIKKPATKLTYVD